MKALNSITGLLTAVVIWASLFGTYLIARDINEGPFPGIQIFWENPYLLFLFLPAPIYVSCLVLRKIFKF